MTGSEVRKRLSLLIATFGSDGALVVPKSGLDADGADLAPGSALKWPPCQCGSRKCPDYKTPGAPSAEELSARVKERNRRSSRGGM
ncbi:hypothetical protein ACIOJD_08965 [Streptomyces sp. NPDC088116]|uniref:hypothetical protein n=1 Tax=Streptomyces sp. NPDC088116 TaxID=3365825 RepID=UPI0038193876